MLRAHEPILQPRFTLQHSALSHNSKGKISSLNLVAAPKRLIIPCLPYLVHLPLLRNIRVITRSYSMVTEVRETSSGHETFPLNTEAKETDFEGKTHTATKRYQISEYLLVSQAPGA